LTTSSITHTLDSEGATAAAATRAAALIEELTLGIRNVRVLSVAVIVGGLLLAGVPQASASLPLTPDATWGTGGLDGKVDAVLRIGNTIYLGGAFTTLEDPISGQIQPVTYLAGIDATTGQPTTFAPVLNGEVFALAQSPDGSRLYVGGNFTTVGGKTQRRVAAFDTATGQLINWKPFGWPNNVVRALAAPLTASTSEAASPRSGQPRSPASPR
jgi:hypothetical protein